MNAQVKEYYVAIDGLMDNAARTLHIEDYTDLLEEVELSADARHMAIKDQQLEENECN